MNSRHLLAQSKISPSPGHNSAVVVTGVISRGTGAQRPAGRYVVEIARSATAFDPAAVPRLDLFELYHLYWDTPLQSTQAHHSLRLGFFSEEPLANTVARYLSSYFESPGVLYVDATEVNRAARQAFAPLHDVGASGRHAAIELKGSPACPVVISAARRPAATAVEDRRTLWSRLLTPFQR
jgi:hypothetical protein